MTITDRPRFSFVNAVWGQEYVDVFTGISIPTLLASRNLPALPNLAISEFLIVTTPEDETSIRAHPIYPLLEQIIEVVFLRVEITTEHKYDIMKSAHAAAIRRARDRGGYCIFLAPDALVSNGMLTRLYELCVAGRRVVAGFGPRLDQDETVAELYADRNYRAGEPLELAPRDLVALAMRHLHQDFRNHFADSPHFPAKPYCCAWRGPDGDGVLVRSIGLHPYLFDARLVPPDGDLVNATIDYNLIPRFASDPNSFYVETDSDNFNIYGLTPGTARAKPNAPNRLDRERLSLWLLRAEYAFANRASFLYPIKFHARDLGPQWDQLTRQTHEFALDVIDPSRSLLDWTRVGYSLTRRTCDESMVATGASPSLRDPARAGMAATAITADLSQVPFFYSFAVWGERYVDLLARWAIPSLLAPGNLPALPNLPVSKFLIATTPDDEKRIRLRPEFRLLERFVEVIFAHFPQMPQQSDKYAGLRIGHGWGEDMATGKGFISFLGPDAIYPDGMFSALYRHASEGKQVVVGMGPRVEEETIAEELARAERLDHAEPLIVLPREAAALFLRHMHPDAKRLRWNSPSFPETPYACLWEIGGDGILLRSFSLHPYIVDCRDIVGGRGSSDQHSVADGTFVADGLFHWDRIHQVTDSDEFLVLSITPKNTAEFPDQINVDPFASLLRWVNRSDVTMLHRLYFMRALKIHAGDLDRRWRYLEQETLRLGYQLFDPHAPRAGTGDRADDPLSRTVARYVQIVDPVFDRLFINRFPAVFDGHFRHHFPDRFDAAFVERFPLPFDIHFTQNFTGRFDAAFRERFDAAFRERFDAAFHERFDAAFRERFDAAFHERFDAVLQGALEERLSLRWIGRAAWRRLWRRG